MGRLSDIRDGALEIVAGGRDDHGLLALEHAQLPVVGELAARLADHETCMFNVSAAWNEKSELLDDLATWWGETTLEFTRRLQLRNVQDLLLCPGHGLETLPVHLAPAWADRFTLAYAPSLALSQHTMDASLADGLDIHRGDLTSGPLPQLDHEVNVVRSAHHRTDESADFLRPQSRFVHYAGHATGRAAIRSRVLKMSDRPITVADILVDADFFGVETVTLSGCSTGVFLHHSASPLSLGGIDYALVAVGARSIVSTMWDVHDTAASLFMGVFHVCLGAGVNTADSFRTSRDFLRSDDGHLADRIAEPLSKGWPNWRSDAKADDVFGRSVHWGAFRLVGRYW